MKRREFLVSAAAGCAACLGAGKLLRAAPAIAGSPLVSPGCRGTKVKVAKLYLGIPKAMWPHPKMDLGEEIKTYEAEFAKKEYADIEFTGNELLTSRDGIAKVEDALKAADGVLAIHLSMGVTDILMGVLAAKKPTVLFAAPYSGHEWASFGSLRKREEGALLECILSSDFGQIAAGLRPIRAIHHLREAKILNLTANAPSPDWVKAIGGKFGTQVQVLGLPRMLDAYEAVPPADAEAETERWISGAEKVVEPPRDEVFRSAKLALAFEKVLAAENATCLTVECYGSMYRKLPAFPCVGFVRLNNLGLGGICESDMTSAMTHVLLQGLTGKPGFISDPTMDESKKAIILAHCLGSLKMDGPDGPAARYRLRTIMERQEGCVPQAFFRVGQKVTQLELFGTDLIQYFTGTVIEAPDVDKGCRTKITVQVDGDAQKLWQNWTGGLHRQTVYGDITEDLKRFCRFEKVRLVNEAI